LLVLRHLFACPPPLFPYTTLFRSRPTLSACADSGRPCPLASCSVTILTFNHDLVIENEIFRRSQLVGRWCLDEGYGSFGAEQLRSEEHTSELQSRFDIVCGLLLAN